MTHRRPSRLLAVALGAGLLLSGAPAAGAAPGKADRAPHGAASGARDAGGSSTGRAVEKLRRAVLQDVARTDASVARAGTLSRRTAALTSAHRDALVAAAAAVRADLADLREQVRAADSATRLLALRRAVPGHAGGHLDAVVRLVGKADSAVAASTCADALLTAALDAAVAGGADVSGVQEDAARLLAAAAAARLRTAGDADAALAVGRALAEKRLPAAVKQVRRSVSALRSATDDVEDLTDEVVDLPAPAVQDEVPEDEVPEDEAPEDEAGEPAR